MKWCRVEVAGRAVHAVLEDSWLVELDGAPFAGGVRTAQRHRVEDVLFLPPVLPANFYAAGANYRMHVEWAKQYHGMSALKIPERADVGYRSASALVGSGADIIIPADSPGPVEYEGELVAVIGKVAKRLSQDEALLCVAGYTLGNDLSERSWQLSDRTLWRAKNSDTFKPMGPFVADGIDPMRQSVAVRINGRTVSEYETAAMLFSVAHWISAISRYVTLHPGDVLWLGCDGTTIPALKPGDLVEVCNEAIGVLVNRVVLGQS